MKPYYTKEYTKKFLRYLIDHRKELEKPLKNKILLKFVNIYETALEVYVISSFDVSHYAFMYRNLFYLEDIYDFLRTKFRHDDAYLAATLASEGRIDEFYRKDELSTQFKNWARTIKYMSSRSIHFETFPDEYQDFLKTFRYDDFVDAVVAREIKFFILINDGIDIDKIVEHFGISIERASNLVQQLIKEGLFEKYVL